MFLETCNNPTKNRTKTNEPIVWKRSAHYKTDWSKWSYCVPISLKIYVFMFFRFFFKIFACLKKLSLGFLVFFCFFKGFRCSLGNALLDLTTPSSQPLVLTTPGSGECFPPRVIQATASRSRRIPFKPMQPSSEQSHLRKWFRIQTGPSPGYFFWCIIMFCSSYNHIITSYITCYNMCENYAVTKL